jgi:hypothetical protein
MAGCLGRVSQLGGAVELRRPAGPRGLERILSCVTIVRQVSRDRESRWVFFQRFAASSTVSSSLSSEPSGAALATILKRLHDECRSLDSFDECAPVALAQGCC